MKRVFVAIALLLCFFSTIHSNAQTIQATLGGTVSDASGALIPGVTVTATNIATGVVTSVITNEAGAYQFASLQTGTYKVTAELAGFQTQTYNQVTLGVSQQVRLNVSLQVGSVAQSVEVNVAADTLLATTTSSVGTVLPDYKLKDLPMGGRNVMDLLQSVGGVQRGGRDNNWAIFAGTRSSGLTTTRDGISVNDTRHNDVGAMSIVYTSPDLVEELRVITTPADAEMTRGNAQVQMVTRSGTNQYRGSAFWANRNSALDSSTWFNNFNGVAKDYYNRNQYGVRLGGPIIKNKTFFFVLAEGQRFITRTTVLGNVLTETARRGIFRYYPGAQSGNAISSNPTVDLQGNPVTPRGATGPLSSFSVFGRDSNRSGFDPSGWITGAIGRMPLPNDFTIGDGLNTAGIRWILKRRELENTAGTTPNPDRDDINVRLDHNFNSNHKLFFTGSREWAVTDVQPPQWPGGYDGIGKRRPSIFTLSFVSTLSANLVNEARFGQRKQVLITFSGFERPDGPGPFKALPVKNGIPYIPKTIEFTENYIFGGFNGTRGNIAPRYSYADTVSWTHGHHAFKTGAEIGITHAVGWTNQQAYPYAEMGPGGVPIQGIDATTFPGLQGGDQTSARNLLADLSGSVNDIIQFFVISGSKDPKFLDVSQVGTNPVVPSGDRFFLRDWHQREFSAFIKDDWKLRSNLTLNLGVRYDWYGSLWEGNGIMANAFGGVSGLFGISGTSYAAQWQPGATGGKLTTMQFLGKNSPNPSTPAYANDNNNFGPAIGVSWSLPWWGKDKTVFRAGYGINYDGVMHISNFHNAQAALPGTALIPVYTRASYMSLQNLSLPIPIPSSPLQAVPLTDRSQSFTSYDDHLRDPYVQSFNASIQRELTPDLTFQVRYVGTKGTKLWGGVPLNDVNIFENGILDAFNITRAGGNAPLFDKMLNGLNLGSGVVNGSTVTGSASLRANTLFRTAIANGNVGAFAQTLNSTPTVTGVNGGLLRNGNLPENFIKVNPQFNNVTLFTNAGNSSYHSLVLEVSKRLSHGFTAQSTYTWSRALGEQDVDGTLNYLNPRKRSLNKALLGFHRTHDFRTNGVWQLPFGPGQALLGNAPSFISRLVERWQLGGIWSMASGAPLSLNAAVSTFTGVSNQNTPVIAGDFAKSMGKVTKVANGVTYFSGLQQVADPAVADVTALQSVQSQFSNKAIADSRGNILLKNPAPGQIGNMGLKWIQGPGTLNLDMNLTKRVRITETKEFELRVDAVNVMNHQNFDVPNLNIDNINFGRITNTLGNRSFVLNARLNF